MVIPELHLLAMLLIGVGIGWLARGRRTYRKNVDLITSLLQVVAEQAAELGRK